MNSYNTSDIFGGSFNAAAHYDAVKVQLASPETIRSWSRGEVKNPETKKTLMNQLDSLKSGLGYITQI